MSDEEFPNYDRFTNTNYPLAPEKQKWLNLAYKNVRAIRDQSDGMVKETLTNVLSALILVDGE
jgi:hypothetical protein